LTFADMNAAAIDKEIWSHLNMGAVDAWEATTKLDKYMTVIEDVEELIRKKRQLRRSLEELAEISGDEG